MSHLRPTRHMPRLATAALGAVLVVGLAGCGDDTEPVAGDPTASSSTSDSPEPDTETPDEPDASETPTTTATVPVYFVGDSPLGVRLYREFRQVTDDDAALAAAQLLTSGDAADPDYRTLLDGLDVTAVTAADGFIDVEASADGATERPPRMSSEDARVALQSLVYTLQGALQSSDPVRFTGTDMPRTVLGVDTTEPLTTADQLDVLNLVSITTPAEGETVSGTFTAQGRSSSFEATTPWEVRDSSGKVVLDGFATAEGWMDRLYPWTTEVDVSSLAPGDYTFAALTDDPTGGAEGPGASEDTRAITIS